MRRSLPLAAARSSITDASGGAAGPMALMRAIGREKGRVRSGAAAAGLGDTGERMGCPCAPKVPDGLVDLGPAELSGAASGSVLDEPVPIYNAPALAPTEQSRREAARVAGPGPWSAPSGPGTPPVAAPGQRLPIGAAALAAGMAQTPTTPPAPVPAGPVYPGPIPPPTYQSASPGLVPTGWSPMTPVRAESAPGRPGPGGRRASVDHARVGRFRRLSERAIIVLRTAAGGARAADSGAARALKACVDRLAAVVGDFGRAVARLRRADDAGAAAELLLDEVAALEEFASCAAAVLGKAGAP